jgi:hypothetical protein
MQIFYYLEAHMPMIIWGAAVLGLLKGLLTQKKKKKNIE